MRQLKLPRLANLLFIAAFFGLLSTPLLTHNWRSDPGVLASENRYPSPFPERPRSWQALLSWPKQADAYLADHFGQRTNMVKTFNRIRYRLFGETPTEQTVFGQHDRLFLTSHTVTAPYSLISFICGFDVSDAALDQGISEMATFFRQAKSAAAESYLMVVPTAPTLYFQDLPHWLQAACPHTNTMDRFLARMPAGDLRDRLDYPLATMQNPGGRQAAIPLTNFHWMGTGPEAVAVAFAEGRLKLPRRIELPTVEQTEPSDLFHMIPGVPAASVVRLPDFTAAGIEYCRYSGCFPEWGNLAGIIFDLTRVHSPRSGDKKLLILSDSFGHGIAGWFAPYFGSIWHFSVSFLDRLSADERVAFRRHIFEEYKPDVVLYVFNDGAVTFWPKVAASALWRP